MVSIRTSKRLFFILVFASCFQLFSQNRVYKHYGVEDGLPSSEVYSAFQDSKGYMWFTTDAGVTRFNGYEFENFDVSDGLTDNTVFLMREDYKGRIWFGTFNCQLSYYENDSIYAYPFNYQIEKHQLGNVAIHSFAIDSNDNIYLGFFYKGIYKCDNKGNCQEILNETAKGKSALKILRVGNNSVFGYIEEEKEWSDGEKIKKDSEDINVSFQLGEIVDVNLFINSIDGKKSLSLQFYKKDVLVVFNETIFLIKKLKEQWVKLPLEAPFMKKDNLTSIMIDGDIVWFCFRNTGAYKCKIKGKKVIVIEHFLKDKPISRVFKDNRGGHWFQILNEGVYYLPSDNITYKDWKHNKVKYIEVDTINGDLFLAFEDGKIVSKSKENEFEKGLIDKREFSSRIHFDDENKLLLIGGVKKKFEFIKAGKTVTKEGILNLTSKSFLVDKDTIYRVGNSGLSILYKDKEIYSSYYEGYEMWCSSVMKDKVNVWIGTNEGVKVYAHGKITKPYQSNKYLSSYITCMERLNDSVFLVGTKSYGVLVIKDDEVIDRLEEKNGLAGNLVKAIHVDNRGTLWVGTNIGVSRIYYKGIQNYQIYNLTRKHGLISQEATDIDSYKDTIYILTLKGLISFDRNSIKINTNLPPIFITGFHVNSLKMNTDEELNFPFDENFIKITFEGINYRSQGEVKYKYRMLGVDTNWTLTQARSVQYPTLQSNTYTFEVKAKNEDGFWSVPSTLSFTINPPFWLTWWFIVLEVLMSIGLIAVIFWYREKQNISKSEVTKKLLELELKSLRSQMNPHFIFNTLNTIQNAIYSLDKKVAVGYVSKFGKLIRIVLESSKYAKIKLDLEIEMLEYYIDLESIRFSKKIQYQIEVDPLLMNDSYLIPTMMIQPFIENSILHGLHPKKGDNLSLLISFSLRDEVTLICTIEDNGIGRRASEKLNQLKNLNKQSMGVEITGQRLNLYSKDENHDFSYQIIDLEDDNKNALGTKVQLIFPV